MNDQQFQEQLLLAELPAPTGVWERMLAVLDEDAEDAAHQTELNFSAVTPPASVWNSIEEELDEWKEDEVLAATINQNTVTASPLLWDNIEALLDADADKEFAATLNNTEVKAPADAWTHIENELHPQAKIIPITKRYATFYRMAAAAVMIGFVTWMGFQLLPKQSTQATLTENRPVPKNVSTPSDTNTKFPEPAIAVAELKPIAPKEESNLTALYKPKQAKNRIATDVVMQHDKPTKKKTDFSETNYLMVLNDNGDLIRVSKKLSTMDCAQNGDVPVDAITALQAKDCDAQIKKLQQRMATSVMGSILDPSTLTNSTDK